MKKVIIYFSVIAASCILGSCSDLAFGDAFLEKAPGVDVTIDTIFSSKLYADRALNSAYATLRTGLTVHANDGNFEHQQAGNKLGWDNLDALTDIMNSHCNWGGVYPTYYNGSYSSETENTASSTKMGFYPNQDVTWRGIRKAYLYIENVDRVPDMTEAEKNVRKGEAQMIIACQYHELLRHFGGVPLLYSSVDASNSLEVDFSRKTFEKTVEFIINLCDDAAKKLPWRVAAVDDGRFTKAAALGLKVRVLLLAASPLFNANQPYLEACSPVAGNVGKISAEDVDKMVWYGNYERKRWERVVTACEEFFAENARNGNVYQLVQPETRDAEGYRKAFSGCYADRYNSEILIATFRNLRTFGDSYHRMYFGPSSDTNGNAGRGYGGGAVTLDYVDMFTSAIGEKTSYEEWIEKNGSIGTIDNNPFTDRDPRLYETVMIVGDHFQSRPAEMWIGGLERGSETDGGRAPSGFCIRKFLWDYNQSTFHDRPANYAYLRMAEIHLAYAEALNETGQKDKAYKELDKVRNRVGLPDMSDALLHRLQSGKSLPVYNECALEGDAELREEILDERARELAFEEVRWFDIARWKRADVFKKTLHGVNVTIKSGSVAEGNLQLNFEEPKVESVSRFWQKNFSPKWYMSAFPSDEINKGYGLLQNPGW
ncbi:RagB/SusD family nutrient uptake outer membrane protein [Bacteroides acidifaciens]|uniref:RagB/SusD family nutrient uptake outer membrane protein n=1 Tax=Bacteroides acidifaciens TaxID=85831 RepID=A0A4S2B1L4_9BACE|nr:RagB/SusD family nutrient uptake outer membrane protein [Bacteroides acidifaciens]TGY07906.1 RagB/SusD family nutrient uptake outer membrane protein [Bacteroides acidifaciens]